MYSICGSIWSHIIEIGAQHQTSQGWNWNSPKKMNENIVLLNQMGESHKKNATNPNETHILSIVTFLKWMKRCVVNFVIVVLIFDLFWLIARQVIRTETYLIRSVTSWNACCSYSNIVTWKVPTFKLMFKKWKQTCNSESPYIALHKSKVRDAHILFNQLLNPISSWNFNWNSPLLN